MYLGKQSGNPLERNGERPVEHGSRTGNIAPGNSIGRCGLVHELDVHAEL